MRAKSLFKGLAAFTSFVLLSGNIYSQQIISSSGGNGQNISGTISYTLGELTIATQSDGSNTLTQGFHQTSIIITAINDQTTPGISILAYPNPTCDFVTIKFESDDTGCLECILFDLSGSMLLREKQIFNEKKISFEKYNPGIYFMKIISEGKVIQTFKIIKK